MPDRDSGVGGLSPDQLSRRAARAAAANRDLLDNSLDEGDLSVLLDLTPPPVAPPRLPPTMATPPTTSGSAPLAATLKAHITIPQYSGRPCGSTFQGEKGTQTEMYTARAWARRVSRVKTAANWTDQVAAQHAQLALIPNQPSGLWSANMYDEPYMDTWTDMMPQLIKEFSPFINASDKVDILRSFSQAPNEPSGPYLHRIQLQYKRFIEALEGEFSGPEWQNETAAEKAKRAKIIKTVTSFHLATFFLVGLHDGLLKDVTKANVHKLEDMLAVAKISEAAIEQGRKRHVIAGVPEPQHVHQPDEFDPEVDDEFVAFVRGQLNKSISRARGRGRGSSSAGRGRQSYSCYFCFIPGHLANECQRRQRERADGKWRDSVQDTAVSKAEFDARPPRQGRTRPAAQQNAVDTEEADTSVEAMYNEYYSKN